MPRKHDAHRDELEGVAQRLRSERPEASPLEMDRIKTSAMSRAQAGARRGGANARRFAVAGLTVGLMAAGTGGVLASVGSGGASSNAATAQYGSSCDTNNGNGNSTGSGNGNKDGNGNGNTSFAAYYGKSGGYKGKGGGNGDNNGNGSNNNSSGNGVENGNGNGNENGNESNDGNNNFNCNENSFNETSITETNNSTTYNNVTNNFYSSAVTVTAAAPAGSGGVQASTTTKKASVKHPVKFRIDISKKSKLRKVTLKINGKVVSVLKGKKAKATISIANLPCSPSGTTVTVTAVTALGKTLTESHTYYLCS